MQHIRFPEVNAAKACGGVAFSLESKSAPKRSIFKINATFPN